MDIIKANLTEKYRRADEPATGKFNLELEIQFPNAKEAVLFQQKVLELIANNAVDN